MRKFSLVLAAAFTAALILTGCASKLHEGGNYVRGESEGFNFCGFMTFLPVSYSDAQMELLKNANIQDPTKVILTKYYMEPSSKYFVIFSLPKVTLEAEKTDLSKYDCKLIKAHARGVDKGFKFLGFMDFVPTNYGDAIHNLYKKADVDSNSNVTITNVQIEYNSMYFIVFALPELKVTGDIVVVTPKPGVAGVTPAPVAAPAAAPVFTPVPAKAHAAPATVK